ncbi:MAG: hypothetical protein A3E84_03570 [Gammaproteobacteria bacterium RIFCSPHIGHO2_12_FULL_42_13]|nr:MAG: hypothetical protein A3E84_03570 [Gammaproteobacteria bacterium RIFCSPHIGHO2_12_FULL_42_13]
MIHRAHHNITRKNISVHAVKVLYRLKDSGYDAFLVGGGVRDLLLGFHPKDFDVVTNAHPEKIRSIFRNSRIIGRRFRLVHVYFEDEIIEVSTFRANIIEESRESPNTKMSMIYRNNQYGTIEEDAWRRDFTVNALYYNISDFSIIDFCGGMHDIQHRFIRMIGDPAQRYHEDPVRLLRAIRLSAKLNFRIETQTESALIALPHLLQHVPASRLFDECLKLFFKGNASDTFKALHHYHYLEVLFPQVIEALSIPKFEKLIQLALMETDTRFVKGDSLNPAFLFSVFLWPAFQLKIEKFRNKKNKLYFQIHQSIDEVMEQQLKTVTITRRNQFAMQAIWILQFQLERRRKSRIAMIASHRYFRAAVDFMGLRVRAGETSDEIFEWWKKFQLADEKGRGKMISALS